ncbi:MAG TPA: hypothetical protein VMK53_07450, partial [Gemmatimonadales bacterium]|nr:hypothetical protein [Gemmatimonadales bacterium]
MSRRHRSVLSAVHRSHPEPRATRGVRDLARLWRYQPRTPFILSILSVLSVFSALSAHAQSGGNGTIYYGHYGRSILVIDEATMRVRDTIPV